MKISELLQRGGLYRTDESASKQADHFENLRALSGTIENRYVDGCCGNGGCTCNASCNSSDIDDTATLKR